MRWSALFAVALFAAAAPSARAADYIPVDATDFSQCPEQNPIMTDPGLGTANTWNTNSGPFQPHTWYGSTHHWVFVSTSSGIQLSDLHSGSAVASGTIGSGSGYLGIELVDMGVSGHRLLVGLRNDDRLRVWDVAFSDPAGTASFVGDVNLQVSKSGYWPCAVGGANDSSVAADSISVLASTVTPGVVFVANECTGGDQGSLDVVTVTGSANPVLKERVRVDKNPTGIALGSSDTLLYLINEKASLVTQALMSPASIGSKVGSLMTFSLDTTPGTGAYLTLETAVNPGCTPVRVVAGTSRVWVTARASHDIQVFDGSDLLSDPVDSRIAVFRVGPAPVGLKLVDSGSSIAVANSNRFDDLNLPKPSFMVFAISTLTGLAGWGDHGHTRLTPSACLTRGMPNGYGDFPRNLAADDERVYMSLAGAAKVKWVNLSSIQSSCP